MPHRGVWVTGPSRSGTSMMAGLFAQHGVFFGRTVAANEYNPKGYFENTYLKKVVAEGAPPDWPGAWWDAMERQGWDGETPWGLKVGPGRRALILPLKPTVIVACHRPLDQIVRSRGRVHWAQGPPRETAKRAYRQLRQLKALTDTPVVAAQTAEVARGEWSSVLPAFDALGVPFDADVAADWVDPSLWGRE